MTQTLNYQQMGTSARNQAHALFSQTMGYVAMTAAFFALGAWLGRNLTGGVGIVAFIAAFAALIAMRFAAQRSAQLTVGLLAAFGLLIGLAVAPVIAYYGSMDPRALWKAGGATALFIAGFGAAGYATRRDLTAVARVCFWALVALIVFGIVLIFVNIPGGDLVYSVLGLVIFAGFTMFDFQRLRTNTDIAAAPLLAASIFLDVLNVFLFFLQIFSGGEALRSEPFDDIVAEKDGHLDDLLTNHSPKFLPPCSPRCEPEARPWSRPRWPGSYADLNHMIGAWTCAPENTASPRSRR